MVEHHMFADDAGSAFDHELQRQRVEFVLGLKDARG